ncbi:hypothetical protein EVAR_66110_1 [Eumeta japonica]|uniref:Uncharacterized protein n=1 Tax=Eumeta variegata TaxID=151549 RepID=A0A4C2A7K1_EUMVA|nr:hypothetical protein EVAR_66110_1 [Eumeta japonica]
MRSFDRGAGAGAVRDKPAAPLGLRALIYPAFVRERRASLPSSAESTRPLRSHLRGPVARSPAPEDAAVLSLCVLGRFAMERSRVHSIFFRNDSGQAHGAKLERARAGRAHVQILIRAVPEAGRVRATRNIFFVKIVLRPVRHRNCSKSGNYRCAGVNIITGGPGAGGGDRRGRAGPPASSHKPGPNYYVISRPAERV